jgi:hypothetical protein
MLCRTRHAQRQASEIGRRKGRGLGKGEWQTLTPPSKAERFVGSHSFARAQLACARRDMRLSTCRGCTCAMRCDCESGGGCIGDALVPPPAVKLGWPRKMLRCQTTSFVPGTRQAVSQSAGLLFIKERFALPLPVFFCFCARSPPPIRSKTSSNDERCPTWERGRGC